MITLWILWSDFCYRFLNTISDFLGFEGPLAGALVLVAVAYWFLKPRTSRNRY